MATSLTKNLKLRVDSNLTANAQYNLNRIDTLGATFIVDTSEVLKIRSVTNITIEPESSDIGGSGVGGTVTIGTPSHPVTNFNVYATNTSLGPSIVLEDQATGGTRKLRLQYKSDLNGSVDTASDRQLSIDVDGAGRSLVLGGNLMVTGGSLGLALTADSNVTLPVTGTLSTLNGTEVLTNKTLDAANNTITGLTNAALDVAAGITYSKLNLSNSISNADISGSANISYSKLNLSNSISDADVASNAGISYSKLNLTNSILDSDIVGPISSYKIDANFGNQPIITQDVVRFQEGGYNTDLGAASGGQSQNLYFRLPNTYGNNGEALTTNGAGDLSWTTTAGTGTVTSVSLAAPAEFTVTGSPVTTSGTLTLGKANQNANLVYAGPATGSPAQPAFRSLTINDLPGTILTQVTTDWVTADGTSKVFVHNLNSLNVDVTLLDLLDNQKIFVNSIIHTDVNTVTLQSSEAPGINSWRIIVQGK